MLHLGLEAWLRTEGRLDVGPGPGQRLLPAIIRILRIERWSGGREGGAGAETA